MKIGRFIRMNANVAEGEKYNLIKNELRIGNIISPIGNIDKNFKITKVDLKFKKEIKMREIGTMNIKTLKAESVLTNYIKR